MFFHESLWRLYSNENGDFQGRSQSEKGPSVQSKADRAVRVHEPGASGGIKRGQNNKEDVDEI